MVRVHHDPKYSLYSNLNPRAERRGGFLLQEEPLFLIITIIRVNYLVSTRVKELPERPLECTECRRKVAFTYTEIVGGVVNQNCMCKECPVLEHKLRGMHKEGEYGEGVFGKKGGLCCGNCGTTLEGVRMGHALGCPQCYEVFESVLSEELNKQEVATATKGNIVHKGRSPGETIKVSPSIRLLALNEALNEMLSREDYEQAAQIRDQIKELEDEQKRGEEKNGK